MDPVLDPAAAAAAALAQDRALLEELQARWREARERIRAARMSAAARHGWPVLSAPQRRALLLLQQRLLSTASRGRVVRLSPDQARLAANGLSLALEIATIEWAEAAEGEVSAAATARVLQLVGEAPLPLHTRAVEDPPPYLGWGSLDVLQEPPPEA